MKVRSTRGSFSLLVAGMSAASLFTLACTTTETIAPAEPLPAWGPIVFFGNDIYRELNIVGCVANAEADASASSCAAAFGLHADRARRACDGCMPVVDQAGVELDACRSSKAISSFCRAQGQALATRCKDFYGSPSPDAPTNVCKDHVSVRDYVTMGCGAPPTGGDAGADAGE